MAKKIDYNKVIISIVFIIFFLPIVLSVTRIGQEGTRQFSIYNENWDGTSILRENLEGQGFEFQPIASTLNTLTRLNNDSVGTVAIIGPTVFFDPTETAALAYFIMRGGSVLLADDFGRVNDILGIVNMIMQQVVAGINASGIGFDVLPIAGLKINGSLLMDAQSYYLSPVMPILRNFYSIPGGPSMSGVSRVLTSYPSAISYLAFDNDTGETRWVAGLSYQGVPIASGIMTSTSNSWLEKDVESAKQGEYYPDEDEWRGVQFSVMVPIPLGGLGVGNILICSDPSIFINELMESGYDNAQLVSNIFNWLDVSGSGTIYYDESHLSGGLQGKAILSIFDPFSYVRMYLRYVNSFTMFPLLAPLFPIIMLIFLSRRFPRKRGPSPLLMTKIQQQQSRSFFAAKMTWYLEYQQFDNALGLMYRRLKRVTKKKFGITEDLDNEKILEILQEKYPEEFTFKEVEKILKRVEIITQKSKKISEEEFTQLIIEIKNIEEVVTRPTVV
jgi:hypothetical protein